jgi:hypothetical protein
MTILIPPPREEAYRRYKELSPHDHDYGYWWYVAMYPDRRVSPEGRRVLNLLNWVWKGIYHVGTIEKMNFSLDHAVLASTVPLNSFDDDYLTRLVVAAHDHAIRVEVRAATRVLGYNLNEDLYPVIEVVLSPRDREGGWHEYPQYHRHPTILQAVMTLHREERHEVYQDPPLHGPWLPLPRYTTGQLTHEDLNEALACRPCGREFDSTTEDVVIDGWTDRALHLDCWMKENLSGGVEIRPDQPG